MKKIALLLFFPFLLTSCGSSSITIPKSPFRDDKYVLIGMKSENKIDTYLTDDEFAKLNKAIARGTAMTDKRALKYVRQDETRDLKYAYFGKETSSVFYNSLNSRLDETTRYDNQIKIDNSSTKQIVQTAMGENTTLSINNTYTFDIGTAKGLPKENFYKQHLRTQTNDEKPIISVKTDKTHYGGSEEESEEAVFSVHPYENSILQHFVETESYHFKLLGPNAVYGKSNSKYLVKEAYSIFNKNFTTTLGRKYIAVDNYFYEGLLDDINTDLCFTYFRFYHETLILSEAYGNEGVPILYLEKPALVWFNEVKYNIYYNSNGNYTGTIPTPETPSK